MKIDKKYYNIETDKQIKPVSILLLSDIHFKENYPATKLELIIRNATLENPDYICIAGDLINDAKNPGNLKILQNFLCLLSNIAPVIMSVGNHDLLAKGDDNKWMHYINDNYFDMLSSIPRFHLLDNQRFQHNDIEFTGITMPFDYYETYHEAPDYLKGYCDTLPCQLLRTKDNNLYQVVLFHSPISLLEIAKSNSLPYFTDIDLVLSGHLHGGLTPPILEPIMKNRGIVGPTNLQKRTILPNYVRGHIQTNDFDAIVSTGISKLNIPFTDAIFPPNLNSINIKPKKRVLSNKK